ncbi:hypothetical protein BDQ17DRAFT_1347642 [Cyathus striatus]|nr:hypothetical protein BDQ17DRAFT_1347642 [Cyathus striatus]
MSYRSLFMLAALSSGLTASLARPVARSVESSILIDSSISSSDRPYSQLVHDVEVVGEFYTQSFSGDSVAPVPTSAKFASTIPAARIQITAATDLSTSTEVNVYSPSPLVTAVTSQVPSSVTFDFSYLHTPSPVPQELNNSNLLGNHHFPTQAVLIGGIFTGVFIFTFIVFIIANPRVVRSCCGEPRGRSIAKPHIPHPPSWKRFIPPPIEESRNQRRRKTFSLQRIELGWMRKSQNLTKSQTVSSGFTSDEPVESAVSETMLTQISESAISESITLTAPHGHASPSQELDAFSVEPKNEEPTYYSPYKNVRVLYDVEEEEEPLEDRMSMHYQSPLFSGNCRFSELGQSPKDDSKHSRSFSFPGFGRRRLSVRKEKSRLWHSRHRKCRSEI